MSKHNEELSHAINSHFRAQARKHDQGIAALEGLISNHITTFKQQGLSGFEMTKAIQPLAEQLTNMKQRAGHRDYNSVMPRIAHQMGAAIDKPDWA
jgi:hypothetical protein